MNLLMSQQLFDKINEEAKKYEMTPPAYARALLAKLLIGDGDSPELLIDTVIPRHRNCLR